MMTIPVTHTVFSFMHASDNSKFPPEETAKRIIRLTEQLNSFWKNAQGWAPIEAAELLTRSRLDWQLSLARQLRLFINPADTSESGLLILGWTTLGSLTEGLLKLLLSVYYKTYKTQKIESAIKKIKDKKGDLIDPDALVLNVLRDFFEKNVFPKDAKEQWNKKGEINWIEWIKKIQERRNAIHAFKHRDIGSFNEFYSEMSNYLIFMRKIIYQLPYPGEEYRPRET